MSKSYKVKRKQEEVVIADESSLSKKELYDLNKKEKETSKIKNDKKKQKKKKVTKQTNLGARIFAIIMLALMIASVVASAIAYLAY